MGAEPLVRRTVDKAKAPPAKAGPAKAGNGATKPPAKQPAAKLAAKAKLAPKAPAPTVKVKLTKPVVDMIKWMNDSGELGAELRLGAVAVVLAALNQEDALECLEACMDFPTGRRDPITFVKEGAKMLASQAAEREAEQVDSQALMHEEAPCQDVLESAITDWTAQGDAQSLVSGEIAPLPAEVLDLVDKLVFQDVLPKTTPSDKLGSFLAFLGEGPALEVLTDLSMMEPGLDLGFDRAIQLILDASRPILSAQRGSDFAQRLSRRLRWMVIYLGFLAPLDVSQASFELACLGEAAALHLLKRMVTGASIGHLFADPTEWIRKEARILSGEQKILDEKEKTEKEEQENRDKEAREKREREEQEKKEMEEMERAVEIIEKQNGLGKEKDDRSEVDGKDEKKDGEKEGMDADQGKEENTEKLADSGRAVDKEENGKANDVEMPGERENGKAGESKQDEEKQPEKSEENFDDVPIV